MKKATTEKDYAFARLLGVLIQKAKYIILITVTFALVGALFSVMFTTAVYQAQAKMIINVKSDDTSRWESAKSLVDTCAIIVRSRNVLQPIIDSLGLPDTCESLKDNIQVKSEKDTPVMEVTVWYGDPEMAKAITAKILEFAPAMIVESLEAGSVMTVEDVHGTSEPVSASLAKYVAIFGAFGLVLSCLLFASIHLMDNTFRSEKQLNDLLLSPEGIVHLMDNTFRSEKEIVELLDLPVLGVIPSVESCLKISANSKK